MSRITQPPAQSQPKDSISTFPLASSQSVAKSLSGLRFTRPNCAQIGSWLALGCRYWQLHHWIEGRRIG